jgi:hypothetical protein
MLTSSAVANAKPRVKPYKLTDERGMYLLVKSDGARWWRFDYRRPGGARRNTLSLGVYPDVSLRQARERRDDARRFPRRWMRRSLIRSRTKSARSKP